LSRTLSISQIDRLGDRLRECDPPALTDLEMLQRLRLEYDPSLADVEEVLRSRLRLEATSRLKTVGTIIDKLRRERTRLSSMQDIAGVRTVVGDKAQQDRIVEALCSEFSNARVVDRRIVPRFGYRAVHVIPVVDGCPVEIQVRTILQDGWAQLLEQVADSMGRGIRYGEPPERPDQPMGRGTVGEFVQALMDLSETFASIEDLIASSSSTYPAFESRINPLVAKAARLLDRFLQ
jgi:ppGpp synthetase/RelA/SpoT-type nucleotidyltranferase